MLLATLCRQSSEPIQNAWPTVDASSGSGPVLARPAAWLLLGCALLVGGCASPGMKLNVKPGDHPKTMQMSGMTVTLSSLQPQPHKPKTPGGLSDSALGELISEKATPYKVGPQDVILVTVWDHPEITLPLGQFRTDAATGMVVDEEGFLYFPYIGKVSVAGLTTSQVREALTAQLGKVLQKPQVDVKVVSFRSQKVYIGGEIKAPAVYNVTDIPFTLAEAINRAGGFLPTSDDSRLVLTRGNKTWKLDFQSLMTAGNRIGQILLKDGDSLYVPSTKEEPVYMLGEVAKPGTMPMIHGNLTLAQAVSDAGGILGTSADARSIYVIRQTGSPSAVNVFHLDARNPTAMILADNFALNSRDIVFVDAGTLVRFSRVMGMILPTVSAVTSGALTATEMRYWTTRVK